MRCATRGTHVYQDVVNVLSIAHKLLENSDRLQLQPPANRGWIGDSGAHARANLVAVRRWRSGLDLEIGVVNGAR